MTIKISSKFGLKKYLHNKEIVHFRRVNAGVCGTCSIILGEEKYLGDVNFFLLAEIHAKNIKGLIQDIQTLKMKHHKKIHVDEWYSRLNDDTAQLLNQHNMKAFNERKPQVFFADPPGSGNGINYQVETIMGALSPKHLFLFNESRVPAALQSLPSDFSKEKSEDHQIVTALGYALTSLIDYPFMDNTDIMVPQSVYA